MAAGDLDAITAIHGHYADTTAITFDLRAYTRAEREEWFSHYSATGRHRALVAVDPASEAVLGYASSSQHRAKAAYDTTVETSILLAPSATGAGVGSLLYAELFGLLAGEDVHRAVAGVTVPNPASFALHLRFGYVPVGVFSEQGRKFGRYWDVAWFEKALVT
ncbi:MAG: phosphinothricin acetyltransferase [Actinomycetota bacterium]|jgi:phosphinothricin acetyltransferase|nr:phosphinothricin acetyltransferase [Actinomycetota bacterium]